MGSRASSLRQVYRRHFGTPVVLVASTALLAVALYLPLVRIEKMVFWEHRFSVVTGVFGLFEDGQWVLAALLFFWSVVFPIGKLALLHWLWFGRTDARQRAAVLHWLDVLGKWSMLDVFVVAVLVVAVKLGPLAQVTVEPGLYVFGAAVLLTMLVGARIESLAKRVRG